MDNKRSYQWFNLAKVYDNRKDVLQTIKYLSKALHFQPSIDYYVMRGQSYVQLARQSPPATQSGAARMARMDYSDAQRLAPFDKRVIQLIKMLDQLAVTDDDSDSSANVYHNLLTTVRELTAKIVSEKYEEESDGEPSPARLVDHYIRRSVCYELMTELVADAKPLADRELNKCLKLTKDHPMGGQYVAKRLVKARDDHLKRLDQLFGYKRPILADKVVNDKQVVMALTAKAVDNCSADRELTGDCCRPPVSAGQKMTDDGRNGSNVDHNGNEEAFASDDEYYSEDEVYDSDE